MPRPSYHPADARAFLRDVLARQRAQGMHPTCPEYWADLLDYEIVCELAATACRDLAHYLRLRAEASS